MCANLACTTARFNEAEALKPRIRGEIIIAKTKVKISFNEAEALKPRIPPTGWPNLVELLPCFNEAEALKPRILGQRRQSLQPVGELQ